MDPRRPITVRRWMNIPGSFSWPILRGLTPPILENRRAALRASACSQIGGLLGLERRDSAASQMSVHTPIPDGAVDTPAALAQRLARELFGSSDPTPVLDPSCGNGELLLGALQAAGGEPGFAQRALFGIELRPDRARETRERLLAALRENTTKSQRAAVARALEEHILCGDALDPGLEWPSGTHILANPPWMSLSGRHAARLPAERLELYRESWSVLASGWPSIHGAFLERIARHLRTTGGADTRARVLIPTAVCELERYGPTRSAVRKFARLDAEPLDLGEEVFAGITQPTTLLSLTSGVDPGSPPSSPWKSAPLAGPSVREEALLAHLSSFPRLPDKTFADPGVHTGNSARELIFKEESEALASGAPIAPVRVGRDLTPYQLREPGAWIRTDLERSSSRSFRIPSRARMCAFPILLRQTATHPIAALHSDPTYFRNSLLACRGTPDLDPAYLVAVLNSPLIALWHRRAHRDARQRSFPQVKVGHLATLPFPFVRRSDAPDVHDELSQRVRELAGEAEDLGARVAHIETLVQQAFGLEPFE